MKVHRDIAVHLGRSSIEALAAEVERRLTEGWFRDRDEELRKDLVELCGPYLCFRAPEEGGRIESRIFLIRQKDHSIHVSNIVPVRFGSLSKEQYNDILAQFYESFLKPACDQMGIQADLTSDEKTLEDWISQLSADFLRTFSRAANRSIPHPADAERWYKFLLNVHKEHRNLSAYFLERWFIEDESWPEDRASDLAMQYEFAMALLDYQLERTDHDA